MENTGQITFDDFIRLAMQWEALNTKNPEIDVGKLIKYIYNETNEEEGGSTYDGLQTDPG